KTITYLSDTGCLEIQGASLPMLSRTPGNRVKVCLKRRDIKLSLCSFVHQSSKCFYMNIELIHKIIPSSSSFRHDTTVCLQVKKNEKAQS
ncbi:hypothetical protein, partial [Escherichia coli]|uniref:hypothetical protein n=1 Tax=Escherichia coli TaxID=562 RepID=UPI0030C67518